jgi:serine/threonine protein kinase
MRCGGGCSGAAPIDDARASAGPPRTAPLCDAIRGPRDAHPPVAGLPHHTDVLTPGDLLGGRYEILDLVARGGMGEVYRASRRLLGDKVAVKVIQASASNADELRERFLRESRACAQLRHPNIVSILDFDLDADGRPFLVMELLNGPSLREELRMHGRFPLSVVQSLVGPLAAALKLAHDRGVVHRDLKPANILSHRFETGDVVWKIVDFGLANVRGAPEETQLTGEHEFLGTVAYASPEQLQGEEVDHRSDIYSFGCIVFEMLTGRPPFPGGDLLSLVTRRLTGPAPRPATLVADLPDWLDEAVARALTTRRENRWPDISAFAAGLAGLGETATVTGGIPRAHGLPGWLDKYEMGRLLGRGRLGSEVYAGRHRALGIPVAIRILRRQGDAEWDAIRMRFLQEARALQVAHSSILQVRDFGEEDNAIYVVTDLVEGPSLRELLALAGPLEWPRLRRLVTQMLDAALALHRRGGIICGLCPERIRTTSVLDPELPYVAPEVFMGRAPDVRSDVFTLGVLMYEMATGRLPFQASNMHQLFGTAMSVRPIDPRQLQAGLPDAFAETVLRCLRPLPDERPEGPTRVLALIEESG